MMNRESKAPTANENEPLIGLHFLFGYFESNSVFNNCGES